MRFKAFLSVCSLLILWQAHAAQAGKPERVVKIAAHALFVGGRVFRVVHASVHHGADGFEKSPEQARRDLADRIFGMYSQAGFFHGPSSFASGV